MGLERFALQDEVMMVTGAGRGIGRAIALAAAEIGADLILTSRTHSELEQVAAKVRDRGRRAEILVSDVGQIKEMDKGIETALEVFGKIDVLVNNAGINIPQEVSEVREEDWDAVMNINLKGLFFCTQAVGRHMVQRRKGKVINLASTLGMVGAVDRSVYCASKGGVVQLTRALALEWAPYGVTVNAVAPTAVKTPLTEPLLADPAFHQEMLGRIPVGRIGEVQDVVGGILFLASKAADFITGHILMVDGGYVAR